MIKGKKIKLQNRAKIVIFLILCIFIIGGFIYFKKQNYKPTPETPSTPNNPQNPSNPEKPEEKPVDPEGTSYLNNVKYTVSVDKEIVKAVTDYMDLYYKSVKELKEYDMTQLFSNQEQAYINQTAISLLVNIRKAKATDLKLDKVKYDLDFKSIKEENGYIKIEVRENNYLNFNVTKDIESKVYNITNEFTLHKVDGKFKIAKYNKVQDFFVMVTDKYKSVTDYKTSLDKIKSEALAIVNTKEAALKKDYDNYLNNTGITKRQCDKGYDREKALSHALKWVTKRSPDWTAYESNCQNFASQVLYSGGIPMDYTGSAKDYLQWKAYNSTYNEAEKPTGVVWTWTYVPYFYTYAKNNTGQGLCASVDVNVYYAEAGDVVHVGTNGPTRHAMVVIGTVKKDDKVVDILVNSNTVDLENYPLSAYVYPYTSLIKIYGYNE